MPTASSTELETVRQIVGAVSTYDIALKIATLDEATWSALKEDLPLWGEYRFDNEQKFRAGSFAVENDAALTRMNYRNMYCLPLGFPLFDRNGYKLTETGAYRVFSSSVAIDIE